MVENDNNLQNEPLDTQYDNNPSSETTQTPIEQTYSYIQSERLGAQYNSSQSSEISQTIPADQSYSAYENSMAITEPSLMPETKKRSNAPIVLLILLVVILLFGLVSLSLYSVKDQTNATSAIASDKEKSTIFDKESDTNSKTTADKDKTTSEKTSLPTANRVGDGPYDTPTVAEIGTPSVVGVVQYQSTLYEMSGLGSGIIIGKQDDAYYVVTNNHVVEAGNAFRIRLHDGVDLDAEIVGTDPQSDLAVLRIKTDAELDVADLGDSDILRVGETVIAIGNPVTLDLSGSVTQGIVSALNRIVKTEYKINYIQTDAAINPGNSGGALVNMYGEVIGINTAKARGVDLEGLGFAIPINEAKPIIEELIDHGKVTSRPVLGIEGVEINEMTAYEYNVPSGIMIKGINNGSNFIDQPKLNDIITHINGERIASLADLKSELSKYNVGDTVELTMYREESGKRNNDIKLKVVLIGIDATES